MKIQTHFVFGAVVLIFGVIHSTTPIDRNLLLKSCRGSKFFGFLSSKSSRSEDSNNTMGDNRTGMLTSLTGRKEKGPLLLLLGLGVLKAIVDRKMKSNVDGSNEGSDKWNQFSKWPKPSESGVDETGGSVVDEGGNVGGSRGESWLKKLTEKRGHKHRGHWGEGGGNRRRGDDREESWSGKRTEWKRGDNDEFRGKGGNCTNRTETTNESWVRGNSGSESSAGNSGQYVKRLSYETSNMNGTNVGISTGNESVVNASTGMSSNRDGNGDRGGGGERGGPGGGNRGPGGERGGPGGGDRGPGGERGGTGGERRGPGGGDRGPGGEEWGPGGGDRGRGGEKRGPGGESREQGGEKWGPPGGESRERGGEKWGPGGGDRGRGGEKWGPPGGESRERGGEKWGPGGGDRGRGGESRERGGEKWGPGGGDRARGGESRGPGGESRGRGDERWGTGSETSFQIRDSSRGRWDRGSEISQVGTQYGDRGSDMSYTGTEGKKTFNMKGLFKFMSLLRDGYWNYRQMIKKMISKKREDTGGFSMKSWIMTRRCGKNENESEDGDENSPNDPNGNNGNGNGGIVVNENDNNTNVQTSEGNAYDKVEKMDRVKGMDVKYKTYSEIDNKKNDGISNDKNKRKEDNASVIKEKSIKQAK